MWSDHHGLRAAVRDLLEPHPLGIGHGLLRVPKLAAIGHELGDEGCTLLLLENQEPLRAALRALRSFTRMLPALGGHVVM